MNGHQPEKASSRPKVPSGLSTGARKEMLSIQNDEWIKAYIKHKTGFDIDFGPTIFRRSDLIPIKPVFLLEEGKRKANLNATYEIETFQDKVATGELVSVYEMLDSLCEDITKAVNELVSK